MIVKLDEESASTEDISGDIFYYGENGFSFYSDPRRKVKFMSTEHEKALYFLDMLILSTQKNWDALHWYKKQ